MPVIEKKPTFRSTLPIPADRLSQALDRTQQKSPEFALTMKAVVWLVQVEVFRDLEDAKLLGGNYSEELSDHKRTLQELIKAGEGIEKRAETIGIDKFVAGFRLSDIQAAIESLRITFRCEHGQKNAKKSHELLRVLLNA